MEITLTTPSLLFPAVSLLLLAYTNRFLALASLIRQLHGDYNNQGNPVQLKQIQNLKLRIVLIKKMQLLGVLSLLVCVICMFVLFAGMKIFGEILFGASLVLMMLSLWYSVREIDISGQALDILLSETSSKKKESIEK
ncbi:MAG: DUF2721 domain-containing protein [SAR324 cluster bacterium]|nr:DUF2721 domain-containing protein [SAR324 cluster bacterium]